MNLVDTSAQPYKVNACNKFASMTTANPDCASSVTTIDLSLGDSATVCRVFRVPSAVTLNEVQFDGSQVFDRCGTGVGLGIWHLGSI